MATKPAIAETTSNEVVSMEAVNPETGEIMSPDMMGALIADAQADTQAFRQDQMTIPRLVILQDLSPQVKNNSPYGARPGMILNTVTGELMTSLTFIPAFYNLRFIAWKLRKNGGGLVNPDVDEAILTEANGFERVNPGKWLGKMKPAENEDPVTVEVMMTGEWAGIHLREDGSMVPVATSWAGSKAKVVRAINTAVDITEIKVGDQFIKPPAYYHRIRLSVASETGAEGDYWNYSATPIGLDLEAHSRSRDRAKELMQAIRAGSAVIDEVSESNV